MESSRTNQMAREEERGGGVVSAPEQRVREGEKQKAAHAEVCDGGRAALMQPCSWVRHALPGSQKSCQPFQPCAAQKDFLVTAQIQETNTSPLS